MLFLKDIKDWLMGLVPSVSGYIEVGRCFQTQQYIGVYGREQPPGSRQVSAGGGNTVFKKDVAIYICWGTPAETEEKAAELYLSLHRQSDFLLNGIRVCFVDPGPLPVPSGKEQEGVHEYALYPTFYYERKEEE